jgi:hypothetical protein
MIFNSPILKILVLTVVFTSGYSFFLRTASVTAEVAESNFQSNLIRLQTFLFEPPPRAVLVGSSLTGRLAPRYFAGTPLDSIANLGLDGSGPAVGLDLLVQHPSPLVVIEENHLLKSKFANDAVLEATLKSFGFRLSRYARVLRAESRPSSVLYSWMKARATRQSEVSPTWTTPLLTSASPSAVGTINPQPDEADSLKTTVRQQVTILRSHGAQVVFVRFPSGERFSASKSSSCMFANELARELGLREIDLQLELARIGQPVSYSDGIHLTPKSAQTASRLLAALLKMD